MKISERCKKQIEDIERLANECKITGDHEPYKIVFWDRDFESIIELYTAYKLLMMTNNEFKEQTQDLTEQLNDLQKAYEANKKRLDDVTEENKNLKDTIKNMNENFREHLNALEAENEKLKKQIESYKYAANVQSKTIKSRDEQIERQREKYKDQCNQLHTIKKSFEVLRALYLGDYEDEPF